MSKRSYFIYSLLLISTILFSSLSNINFLYASFNKVNVNEIDLDDYYYQSQQTNFSDQFRSNINFAFGNTTLGFASYLTLNTLINAPLIFTGYLNKDIKNGETDVGVKINGTSGSIVVGINGTLLVAVNDTINPFTFEQKQINSVTNFSSIIGTNLSLPINVNPIQFEVNTDGILPPNMFITTITVSLRPVMLLKGSISLSAKVENETLLWETGNEIYFKHVNIGDVSNYTFSFTDVKYNFSNVQAEITAIDGTLSFGGNFGELYHTDFTVDLNRVNSSASSPATNKLIAFLLDSLVSVEDQEFTISFSRAPLPFGSVLFALLTVVSITLYVKKRKR